MRKTVGGSGRKLDQLQQLAGLCVRLCLRYTMDDWPLCDQVHDAATRVERGHRVLKNHLDVLAHGTHFTRTGAQKIPAIHIDLATIGFKQTGDDARNGCLARAAFANDAERFALT